MYVMARILFWSVVFVFVLGFVVKKRSINFNSKNFIVLFFIYIMAITLSSFFPLENTFISFSTPEKAFNYYSKGNIELIVEGEESALIIATKEDSNKHLIIPKCDDNWKIGIGLDMKKVKQVARDGFWIFVWRFKETDEYYLTLSSYDDKILDVSDNVDSTFQTSLDSMFSCAYIKDYDENYNVVVNGITIEV